MICKECGVEMSGSDRFCQSCEAVNTLEIEPALETDAEIGVVRWLYELNMWNNPTLIITIFKVVLLAALVPSLLVLVLGVIEGDGILASMIQFFKLYGGILVILSLLMLVAYVIVALINGGSYCVVFEMDEKGVRHTQLRKQYHKAQTLGLLTAMMGTLSGSPSTMGAGLLAASKRSSYSRFRDVKTVTVHHDRHVIYLITKDMMHNQIYTQHEDFKNVTDHILKHIPVSTSIRYK